MEYHPDDAGGGAEVQVWALARAFARAGHEVAYVCQRYDPRRPQRSLQDGVLVLRTLRWRRVARWLAAYRLIRVVHALGPDIVYQRFTSPYTGLAAVAARLAGCPFVWGCAEDSSLMRQAVLGGTRGPTPRDRNLVRRVKDLALSANAALTQVLVDYGIRAAGEVIVQNRRQVELLDESYGRRGIRIPNGVDTDAEQSERSERPLVLWLNGIMRRKRPEAFIALAATLAARRPGVQFALVGGRAEDAYLASIRRLAEGVPGLVLHGAVSHSVARSWAGRAWVVVLTSASEGFPNVLLEAWTAETPVVSLFVDPDGLLAEHGLGRLSGTMAGLIEDVDELLTNSELRSEYGRRARAFTVKHFNIDAIAQRYIELFEGLR